MKARYNGFYSPVKKVMWNYDEYGLWLKADKSPLATFTGGIYAGTLYSACNYMQTYLFELEGFVGLFSPSAPRCKDEVVVHEYGWRSAGASLVCVVKELQTRDFGLPTISVYELLDYLCNLEVQGYEQIESIVEDVRSKKFLSCLSEYNTKFDKLLKEVNNGHW